MARVLHVALLVAVAAAVTDAAFNTPPLGWNSWDTYQGDLNETEFWQTAKIFKQLLSPYGYDTITIDEFWYPNDGTTADSIDQYGRAVVDVNKWPSSKGGLGFKPLADAVHAQGLKLGIHVMHGVPKAALGSQATVLGDPDKHLVSSLNSGVSCPWNSAWYKVNMSAPGAQLYYDSIYQQYADWGVDLIKNDCVFGENFSPLTLSNIQAARKAMDKAGRPMVYSLSPGFDIKNPDVLQDTQSVTDLVNIYRVTQDWHGWQGSDGVPGWPNHFKVANQLSQLIAAPGAHGKSFPDLDMIHPFDDTPSFRMQMTLWSLARSPLIYGGDLRKLTADSPHIQMMTNKVVLALIFNTTDNRQVANDGNTAVWAARDSTATYVGLFRRLGHGSVSVSLQDLGLSGTVQIHDAWTGKAVGSTSSSVTASDLKECSKHSDGECSALYVLTK